MNTPKVVYSTTTDRPVAATIHVVTSGKHRVAKRQPRTRTHVVASWTRKVGESK